MLMVMAPGLRKLMLTAHVATSVGLLGAVAAFLFLAISGLTSRDAEIVRADCLAMNLIAEFVVVPLMLASLLIGIFQSLGTSWGVFRHYWVLVKLSLTILATVVLLIQMDPIGRLASEAAGGPLTQADRMLQMQAAVHSAGGLFVLLILVVLSIYKPRGMTKYGLRRAERHIDAQPLAESANTEPP